MPSAVDVTMKAMAQGVRCSEAIAPAKGKTSGMHAWKLC